MAYLELLDLTGDVPHEGFVEQLHAVRADELGQRSQLVDVRELLCVEGDRSLSRQTDERSLVHREADVPGTHAPQQHFRVPEYVKSMTTRF